MARALKVFRTPIGFHDAYVAATSRKAALEAWGAESDLFQSGSAELVTDPALTAEPLAAPGQIVKRSRGSVSEHLEAAGRLKAKAPKARARDNSKVDDQPARSSKRGPDPKPAPRPKPRPSREALNAAEAALETAQAEAEAETSAFTRREAELRKEREAAEARHRRAIEKVEQQLERTRARYEAAMERWRATL